MFSISLESHSCDFTLSDTDSPHTHTSNIVSAQISVRSWGGWHFLNITESRRFDLPNKFKFNMPLRLRKKNRVAPVYNYVFEFHNNMVSWLLDELQEKSFLIFKYWAEVQCAISL